MLGCWAHARRKFVEAMKENERLASEALVYIGDLYHVETLAAGLDDEERMQIRRRSLILRSASSRSGCRPSTSTHRWGR